MTFLAFIFVLLAPSFLVTIAAPVATYDQKQTGELNVQVHLEDVQIVALLDSGIFGEYGDYDYHYDYSDFTLKPITHHTTTAPASASTISTSSIEPWHTWPTISPAGSSTPSTTLQPEESKIPSKVDSAGLLSSPESTGNLGNVDVETKPGSSSTRPNVSSSAVADSPVIVTNVSDNKETPIVSVESYTQVSTKLLTDETDAYHLSEEKDAIRDAVPAASSSSTQKNPTSVTATQGASETPIEQPQPQTLKKCTPGHGQDQKGRCVRRHLRRRVPSSLLPFGIRLTPRIYRKGDKVPSEASEN